MYYLGIDLHKKYLYTTLMDGGGKIISRNKVNTKFEEVLSFVKNLNSNRPIRAAMEATYNWARLYEILEEEIDEIFLAHPLKTRIIAEARIKTDKIDSEILAHLLRSDLLPTAYIPSKSTREKKNFLRYRMSLVKMRTTLKNKIHSILARNIYDQEDVISLTDIFGKRGIKVLKNLKLSNTKDREILDGYLELISWLNNKIKEVEREIKRENEEDREIRLLKTIPGIGDIIARLIRYEIDDIKRFSSSKKLCSYAGLVPSTYSTGGKTFHGRIIKQGNKWLRWAMTEAAQASLKSSSYFRHYYTQVKRRAGSNGATIATARKLLETVYIVLLTKEVYRERPICFR